MAQVKMQAPLLENILDVSNSFYLDTLGYKPERTSLQELPKESWSNLANERGLNTNSSGVYFPRNQLAVIKQENPLSLFHEYFGHGLYCEQSLDGRKLVELEKKLLEKEKNRFNGYEFTLKELQEFRIENPTFQELNRFKEENLGKYELFALWTEYLLSKENNMLGDFERRYDNFSRKDKEVIDSTINFSESYGNLAAFYAQGMSKIMTKDRVTKLIKDIYKKDLDKIKFALVYGSKKPFSDIDVFMVGKGAPIESHTDWLDAKYKNTVEFQNGLRNFDVRISVPLMNGEFLFGDEEYFEKSKQKILSQPITEKSIKYNLRWSSRMQRLKEENQENEFLRKKFKGYSLTYINNALALRKGKRIFTKEGLLSYSPSESNTELKGGKA